MTSGMVFDAGALIAVERSDRRITSIVDRARHDGVPLTIPAPALAQVLRDPSRQVRLQALLGLPSTRVVWFDRRMAAAVGAMLRRTRTSDVVDAHVVLCALERQLPIATSDAGDLRRLDVSVRLIEV